jgi:hypothetical protein
MRALPSSQHLGRRIGLVAKLLSGSEDLVSGVGARTCLVAKDQGHELARHAYTPSNIVHSGSAHRLRYVAMHFRYCRREPSGPQARQVAIDCQPSPQTLVAGHRSDAARSSRVPLL